MQNDERDRIFRHIKERYYRDGFHKTSMDELASELHISKKTIYKYFPTKEKLIEEIVNHTMENLGGHIGKIVSSEGNAVQKAYNMMSFIGSSNLRFSNKWMNDIKIHSPHLWEKIDEFRTHKLNSVFTAIINQGKKEGLFIDKPTDIVITIFVNSIRSIVNPEYLITSSYNYKDAARITLDILFSGISTSKGKAYFRKLIAKEQK